MDLKGFKDTQGNLHNIATDTLLSDTDLPANSKTVGDRIRILEQQVEELMTSSGVVPSYWKSTLAQKAGNITALSNNISNPFSVGFVTDVHYEENNMESPSLMKYLKSNTSIDSFVCGGDIIIQQPTKSEAVAMMTDWRDKCSSLGMAYCIGNHDLNGQESSDSTVYLSEAEWRTLFPSDMTGVTYYDHPSGDVTAFGYRDHADKKIREIFINTGATGTDNNAHFSTALTWAVRTKIQELDSNWGVIIYAHKYWQPGQLSNGQTENVASYISQYIPSSHACEIIALITGHCHNDNHKYDETHGYIILSTTCDSSGRQASNLDKVNPTRTKGTITEQAFDIYTIDRVNKKIYATRIGAGSDREYLYTNREIPTGYTVTTNLTNAVVTGYTSPITEGASFSATVSANTGYTLSSVSVTMGGNDITSTSYNNGTISINSVSGNIVITAVAQDVFANAVSSSMTSLEDSSVFNTTGYRDGYYLSNLTTYTASTGFVVTGIMPWSLGIEATPQEVGDIYIYGAEDGFSDSHDRFAFIHSGSTVSTLMSNTNSVGILGYFDIETLGTNYYKLTPKASSVSGRGTIITEKKATSVEYIQCSFKCPSGSSLVIGLGREIPAEYRT